MAFGLPVRSDIYRGFERNFESLQNFGDEGLGDFVFLELGHLLEYRNLMVTFFLSEKYRCFEDCIRNVYS